MDVEVRFEWDEANTKHLARHGIRPAEFEQAMRNDPVLFDYDNVEGEDRWTGIGATDALRTLIVSSTIRHGRIRAITAFDAGKQRAREFWERKGQ